MPFVTGKLITGASGTLPAHNAGDVLVIMALKWGTSGSNPTVPSGWTSSSSSASIYRRSIGWRVAPASGTASGTWTGAEALYVLVWNKATVGATASNGSTSNTAQVPALTLTQPGTSWVAIMGSRDGVAPGLPSGMVERLRGSRVDVYDLYADTNGPVSSWAARAGTFEAVAAIELIPTETPVGITYQPHWSVESTVGITYQPHWSVKELQVGITYQPHWAVEAYVGITYQPRWSVASFGTWRDLILTPEWLDQLAATDIVIDSYAELVDLDGNTVSVIVDGDQRDRLPLSGGSVEFHGSQAEQWSATLSFSDPWMIPRTAQHPLWGTSLLRVRLWWGTRTERTWLWMPVCTLALGDVDAESDGLVSGSVTCRDMLSTLTGGYTGSLDVAGERVDIAIRMVLDRCAPTLPVQIAATDEIVADGVVLGGDDNPLADVIELSAIGWPGGGPRTDREGIVQIGPRPIPAGPVLDWQEGPGNPVVKYSLSHGITNMGNQQTAVSTHPDAKGLYVTVQDDDPSSPTWVGGPWGVHPLPVITSDKTTTESGLRSLALMGLGKGLAPTQKISLQVPQRPDLLYRHPLLLACADLGVAGIRRVLSWSLTLPVRGTAPALMTVETSQEYAS